ncbi:MAG: SNF2-related protein [Pseudomonadota bacterium]|nr:SNF2-related protein [Pseudomonadota bacterium]
MLREKPAADLTPYQTKYYAYQLTKRCPTDSMEKLAGALVDAQVDLNPHQVEAALFAFRSPLSRGAILADEVGLGKTIEAGLVLSQRWAERRRRILIITPASLRKQWYQELQEKFFLPSRILETKSYKTAVDAGAINPFDADDIVLCSYQFARNKAHDVAHIRWDLVVIDEAHRLRNVYKKSNVIARTLRDALNHAPKLLLTATPLQNSLLELFGLVSFVDDRVFGDLASFREQFSRITNQSTFDTLKSRIKPICFRTLRRQVRLYVPYTKRHAILQEFKPGPEEAALYDLVSDYLRRDNLQALPSGQRTLMTLVLRKLLASSSFAIAGALDTLANRLKKKLRNATVVPDPSDELAADFEAYDELTDEWGDAEPPEQISPAERDALVREIDELETFRDLAVSITENAKGRALLAALKTAFQTADQLGGARKAVVFTESRRTQDYLVRLLKDSPYGEDLVLFNGTNSDSDSRATYNAWAERHQGTDRITGSRTADMRSALVDFFREQGQIMIATEAGAEGINLQFCSLVVNYDLPWNPQRIEQRIGRCHRYGQKHDVVVVNFINSENEADRRVYELLAQKFLLFEGVFGASDEVLGSIESGVDFEKRINDIYQRCREPEEIRQAFDQLQLDLGHQINAAMDATREKLLEHFDQEVIEKLRVSHNDSAAYLNRYERMLMDLTRTEINGHARFEDDAAFELISLPHGLGGDIPLGRYELPRRSGEAHYYRLSHPLARHLLSTATERQLEPARLLFDYEAHPGNVAAIEGLRGRGGALLLEQLTVQSLDQTEDYLVFECRTWDGERLDENQLHRLLGLPAITEGEGLTGPHDHDVWVDFRSTIDQKCDDVRRQIRQRNADFFEAEAAKLDAWADDLKVGLEREIKDLDRQIKEARRAATAAPTLEEKLHVQKQIRALESQRGQKRRALFDAQDDIDGKRDQMIEEMADKLELRETRTELFRILWRLA